MGVARPRPGRRRFGLPVAAGGAALIAPVFSLHNVSRQFAAGGTEFRLFVPRLDIHPGAKLAFVGESGSGKSTLLELLAMILRPSASEGFFFTPCENGSRYDIAASWQRGDADALAELRGRHIGYVLQSGGLLPYLSVRDNIELSRRLLRLPVADSAQHWGERLHIAPQLDKLPGELSVGQRQRAAIARALAHEPRVLIADEPTASIDPVNAERIMKLMTSLVDELGVTLILASHAHGLARRSGLSLIEHRIDESASDRMHVTVSGALH